MAEATKLNRLTEDQALRIVSAAMAIRLGTRGTSLVLDRYELCVTWQGPGEYVCWWRFLYASAVDPTFWTELNDATEEVRILDVMATGPDGGMLWR